MAFYDEDDEDQLDPNAPAAVTTGPQSAAIQGQGSGASAAQAGKSAPDKSGNFVGIKQYLDANKSQAAKLGDETAGIINNSANEARQSVNSLNQAADQSIKPIQSLGQSILSKIGSNAESLSAQERQQVKDTSKAKYTGPNTVSDLGDTYTNALKANQKAQENIQKSGTEEGRMSLISQVNNKPRTQGMNVFDNALLQAGGGREKLAQASQANKDAVGAFDTAAQSINTRIGRLDDPSTPNINEATGAKGQTAQAQYDSQKAVTDALNAWKASFQPKVQQAQNDLIGLQSRVMADIGDNPYGLEQEALDLLGLKSGDRIFGLDLNTYLNQASPTDINAANVASAEDYARYGALADLAGETDLMLRPENASKAGMMPNLSADREKLAADMKAAEDAYLQAYRTTTGLSSRPGVAGYTVEQIENQVLPGLIADGKYSITVKELQDALEKFKADHQYGNVINPKSATLGPVNPGKGK